MARLEVQGPLNATQQLVTDETDVGSVLSLSTTSVGIGSTVLDALLGVGGDVLLESNGSPKLAIHSRGNGTQHYSIRVTNNRDPAGGRRFVIRNEDHARDDVVLDNAGVISIPGDLNVERNGSPQINLHSRGYGAQHYSIRATNDRDAAGGHLLVFRNESRGSDDLVLDNHGDLKLEHSGSPKLTLYSRGNGTQRYSIRVTNDDDAAGGRLLVIRNESTNEDVVVIDNSGNVRVPGDIVLTGADVAERMNVSDEPEPGDVMVIGEGGSLRRCSSGYDHRVAGIIAGAAGRPGVVLGADRTGTATGALLALSGTVMAKVDAVDAPLRVGDLLTTSAIQGHAMAARDRDRAFGAVLGKAMAPLSSGVGLLPVLVSLQ